MTTTTTAWRRETLAVDGCATSYVRGGAGAPLLFLHGLENLAAPAPFLDALAARFDVVVPDHPGYGASEMPPWLDSVHDLAYFYLDFVRALGLERVHLAGHALGGWVALEIAVRNTGALRSLTLVDAAGVQVAGIDGLDPFLTAPDVLRRALWADPSKAPEPPSDEASVDAQLRNAVTTARLGWDPRFFDRDLPKWLHRVDVPTLVVWGAEDPMFPLAWGAELARLIPGARLEVVERAGHLPHLEQPQAFAELVARFASPQTQGDKP